MSLQPLEEIEDFYKKQDPWNYENNSEDQNRKSILLSELDKLGVPSRLLDIGCGHGFITRDLKADLIYGVDISDKAIQQANKISSAKNIRYLASDMFDLELALFGGKQFDMVLITGVLYPQYIGNSKTTILEIIDRLLTSGGWLVSVHVNEWYKTKFPYVMTHNLSYKYREYEHLLEVYRK